MILWQHIGLKRPKISKTKFLVISKESGTEVDQVLGLSAEEPEPHVQLIFELLSQFDCRDRHFGR